jgi:hypothetical protein
MFARGFKTWCENTAVGLRRQLGIALEDPLDPAALAQHLGVAVWAAHDVPGADDDTLRVLLHDDPSSWSAVTVHAAGASVIITNSAHSGGRPASDLMHELAHLVLGHEAARVDVSEDGHLVLHTFDRAQEDEANWLSGCLLLPRVALLHAREHGWTSRRIADHYGVSETMVGYRMNVSGVEAQMKRRKNWAPGRR